MTEYIKNIQEQCEVISFLEDDAEENHNEEESVQYQEEIAQINEEEIAYPIIQVHQVQSKQSIEGQHLEKKQTQCQQAQQIPEIKVKQKVENQCKDKINLDTKHQEDVQTIELLKTQKNELSHCLAKQEQNQTHQNYQMSQNNGFSVVIHQVKSTQTLPQYENYADDTHIQPAVVSKTQEITKRQSQTEHLQQLIKQKAQKLKKQLKQQQQYDFYVQKLQQKWAQRQKQQQAKNTTKQQKQITITNVIKAQKQQLKSQKKSFKVKKMKDQSLNQEYRSIKSQKSKVKSPKNQKNQNNLSNQKNQNDLTNQKQYRILKNISPKNSQNQSNIKVNKKKIHANLSFEKSTPSIKRQPRKNLSNFQTVNQSYEKSPLKKSKNQINQDIFYQISIGKSVEMMSHILEDRYYNKISTDQAKQNKLIRDSSTNKIRKIIKRSPYGLLEIQVKEQKNSPKITNLRILKPKQMIRLKKVSRIVKFNKQNQSNFQSKKISGKPFQESISQRYRKLLKENQNELPLINAKK